MGILQLQVSPFTVFSLIEALGLKTGIRGASILSSNVLNFKITLKTTRESRPT